MSEKTYRIWNLGIGWTVFAIALFTFGSTVEPTASFWDAGEYIAKVNNAIAKTVHPIPKFQIRYVFSLMLILPNFDTNVRINQGRENAKSRVKNYLLRFKLCF